MKIAILIGVKGYKAPQIDLPACSLDAKYFHDLLLSCGEFDKIYLINEETSSAAIKDRLAEIIKENQNKKPDQLFFYYSGHGELAGDDFYFIPSDYQTAKRNSTSIKNSELDIMLKSISPNVLIKVIDACQSGVSYIKDSKAIQSYLDSAKASFSKLYFMFSSQANQYSISDNQISVFSKSFLKSILENSGKQIRYKEIMNYISDDEDLAMHQQPFFVTQANLTDKFCDATVSVIKSLPSHLLIQSDKISETATEDSSQTLISLISEDAKRYCNKKDVFDILENIKTAINNYHFKPIISDLFEIKRMFIENDFEVPSGEVIGKFIEDNSNIYYAKATYSKQDDNWPKYKFQPVGNWIYDPLYTTAKTINIINGYRITCDVPYSKIQIDLASKYPNISWWSLIISFIFSPTDICLFNTKFILNNISWEDRVISQNNLKWVYRTSRLKESTKINDSLNEILDEFAEDVLKSIEDKYQPKDILQKEKAAKG